MRGIAGDADLSLRSHVESIRGMAAHGTASGDARRAKNGQSSPGRRGFNLMRGSRVATANYFQYFRYFIDWLRTGPRSVKLPSSFRCCIQVHLTLYVNWANCRKQVVQMCRFVRGNKDGIEL